VDPALTLNGTSAEQMAQQHPAPILRPMRQAAILSGTHFTAQEPLSQGRGAA
jgi:hypothetical protein